MNRSKFIYVVISLLFLLIFAGCEADLINTNMENTNQQETKKIDALVPLGSSGTLTLSPAQDGRVFEIEPDDAADDATYFASQTWTWSGKEGSVRSLLQFNLNSLPSNAVVTNAWLYLYHHPDISHSSQSSSNASYLERVTQSWNAGMANWNNQPAVTTTNRVYLSQATSSTQDYTLNVTAMINDMRQYGNYGMRLKLATESRYARMYFASSDYTNSAYHPKLVITYTLGGGEDSATPFDGELGLYSFAVNNDVADIVKHGITFTIAYHDPKYYNSTQLDPWLDECAAAGLKVVLQVPAVYVNSGNITAIRTFINIFKNKPAVVGWYLYDEPSSSGLNLIDIWIRCTSAYNAIKALDSKPMVICFNHTNKEEMGNFKNCYDIAALDIYVCFRGEGEYAGMSSFITGVENGQYIALKEAGKPYIIIPQAFGWNPVNGYTARLPTDGESRFMHYYPILRSASAACNWSLNYCLKSLPLIKEAYPWSGTTWLTSDYPGEKVFMWRREEFAALQPALAAGALGSGVPYYTNHVLSQVFRNPNTGIYYLILVNESGNTVSALEDLNVPGYTRVQSQFDDYHWVINLDSSQRFIANLRPYQVMIFKLLP
ncbi:MAG: DNRLRE domain-containing protein [Spirochaetales bacterium]|nr:DNRLRE domain-containing protein [Spirochaetales bacterium]